jgi:hypothetical protein
MTGTSLHMQWPLTSQSHGSFLKENNWFLVMDQTPRPGQLLLLHFWENSGRSRTIIRCNFLSYLQNEKNVFFAKKKKYFCNFFVRVNAEM